MIIKGLFLDDVRSCYRTGWYTCRTVNQMKTYIGMNGLPDKMSLDHDLGEDQPTGYDFLKWLIYDMQMDLRNVEITIHSANPVGRKNMEHLLANWIYFCETNEQ